MIFEEHGNPGGRSDSAVLMRPISTLPRADDVADSGVRKILPKTLPVTPLAAGASGPKLTADNGLDSSEAHVLKTSRAAFGRSPNNFESRDPLDEVGPQPPLPDSVYSGFPLGRDRNRKSQMTIRPPPQRRKSNVQVYAHFSTYTRKVSIG